MITAPISTNEVMCTELQALCINVKDTLSEIIRLKAEGSLSKKTIKPLNSRLDAELNAMHQFFENSIINAEMLNARIDKNNQKDGYKTLLWLLIYIAWMGKPGPLDHIHKLIIDKHIAIESLGWNDFPVKGDRAMTSGLWLLASMLTDKHPHYSGKAQNIAKNMIFLIISSQKTDWRYDIAPRSVSHTFSSYILDYTFSENDPNLLLALLIKNPEYFDLNGWFNLKKMSVSNLEYIIERISRTNIKFSKEHKLFLKLLSSAMMDRIHFSDRILQRLCAHALEENNAQFIMELLQSEKLPWESLQEFSSTYCGPHHTFFGNLLILSDHELKNPLLYLLRSPTALKLDFNREVQEGEYQGETPLLYIASQTHRLNDTTIFEAVLDLITSPFLDLKTPPFLDLKTPFLNFNATIKADPAQNTPLMFVCLSQNLLDLFMKRYPDLRKFNFNRPPNASSEHSFPLIALIDAALSGNHAPLKRVLSEIPDLLDFTQTITQRGQVVQSPLINLIRLFRSKAYEGERYLTDFFSKHILKTNLSHEEFNTTCSIGNIKYSPLLLICQVAANDKDIALLMLILTSKKINVNQLDFSALSRVGNQYDANSLWYLCLLAGMGRHEPILELLKRAEPNTLSALDFNICKSHKEKNGNQTAFFLLLFALLEIDNPEILFEKNGLLDCIVNRIPYQSIDLTIMPNGVHENVSSFWVLAHLVYKLTYLQPEHPITRSLTDYTADCLKYHFDKLCFTAPVIYSTNSKEDHNYASSLDWLIEAASNNNNKVFTAYCESAFSNANEENLLSFFRYLEASQLDSKDKFLAAKSALNHHLTRSKSIQPPPPHSKFEPLYEKTFEFAKSADSYHRLAILYLDHKNFKGFEELCLKEEVEASKDAKRIKKLFIDTLVLNQEYTDFKAQTDGTTRPTARLHLLELAKRNCDMNTDPSLMQAIQSEIDDINNASRSSPIEDLSALFDAVEKLESEPGRSSPLDNLGCLAEALPTDTHAFSQESSRYSRSKKAQHLHTLILSAIKEDESRLSSIIRKICDFVSKNPTLVDTILLETSINGCSHLFDTLSLPFKMLDNKLEALDKANALFKTLLSLCVHNLKNDNLDWILSLEDNWGYNLLNVVVNSGSIPLVQRFIENLTAELPSKSHELLTRLALNIDKFSKPLTEGMIAQIEPYLPRGYNKEDLRNRRRGFLVVSTKWDETPENETANGFKESHRSLTTLTTFSEGRSSTLLFSENLTSTNREKEIAGSPELPRHQL